MSAIYSSALKRVSEYNGRLEEEIERHNAITEYYAEGRRGDFRYSAARIAQELSQTAQGFAYHGNALRVAKDMHGVTEEDRSLLDRYATGRHCTMDHVALQDLSNRLAAPEVGE